VVNGNEREWFSENEREWFSENGVYDCEGGV
jgi:hypothetical protein